MQIYVFLFYIGQLSKLIYLSLHKNSENSKLPNNTMLEKIQEILSEIDVLSASNAEEIEALRIKYLSKKGVITSLMNEFRNVPAEQKKEVGMKINELKNKAQEKINELKSAFETNDGDSSDIDITRTAYPIELGSRHPLTIVKNEIIDIFSRLGFSLAEGPEVEDDWHV